MRLFIFLSIILKVNADKYCTGSTYQPINKISISNCRVFGAEPWKFMIQRALDSITINCKYSGELLFNGGDMPIYPSC